MAQVLGTMNDKEILENLGTRIESREKRGWWYTTVYGRQVEVFDVESIITVSMSKTEEDSITDALKQLKAMVFKMVCFHKTS